MRMRFTAGAPAAILLLGILLAGPGRAEAPENVSEAMLLESRQAMAEQRWDRALRGFLDILELKPESGEANFGAGQCLMRLRRPLEAAGHYEAAATSGFALPFARFRQACAFALSGRPARAFAALEQAIAAGFGDLDALRTEEDLSSLRDAPRFAELIAEAERRARPCEFDERYRAFDFWIGEWDVYGPRGQRVGVNTIQRLLDSCLLLENWTSVSGTSGKSINFLDPATGRWRQNWVDQSGQIIEYEGGFEDGAMRFSGRLTDGAGEISLSRMSFTPSGDGTVRQFIELSIDGGGTWSVWFDGIYVPRGQAFPGAGN